MEGPVRALTTPQAVRTWVDNDCMVASATMTAIWYNTTMGKDIGTNDRYRMVAANAIMTIA